MKIQIEIPEEVIVHCNENGIGQRKMRKLFKAFIEQSINFESEMFNSLNDFINFISENNS